MVLAAEDAGVDTVWVPDHLVQAYTTLGFLAAHTSRVRHGTMVTGAPSSSRTGCGRATIPRSRAGISGSPGR